MVIKKDKRTKIRLFIHVSYQGTLHIIRLINPFPASPFYRFITSKYLLYFLLQVISLLETAINNLVTGELMQMSITSAQRCR
jgi:hypothetical protein